MKSGRYASISSRDNSWQWRFFSSALDKTYLERQFAMSSAIQRASARREKVLTTKTSWCTQIEGIDDWSAWLAQGDEPEALEIYRHNADRGLPSGSQKFIGKLQRLTGRVLQYRPRGQPRKVEDRE
jgi:hypothetical protein